MRKAVNTQALIMRLCAWFLAICAVFGGAFDALGGEFTFGAVKQSGAMAAAQRRVVTFMVDAANPPYAYEQDGEFHGISVDLLKEVFTNTPYELELLEAAESRVVELRERGELGEAGFFPVLSENGSYVRSDPLFTLSHGIYTRRDFRRVTLSTAYMEKVGMRWHPYLLKLARSHLGISAYTPYKTTREGIDMLLAGEIDVLFEEESAVSETLGTAGRDSIHAQQNGLFATPVSIVLPGNMADIMDDVNMRVSQVRASGKVMRLISSDASREALDMGGVVVPIAAMGVFALMFVASIIITRQITRRRVREFEALGESFPLIAVGEDGAITFINKPARELFGFIKLSPGKKFVQERFENARTGKILDMPPEKGEPDVLLLKDGEISWRGSMEVSEVRLGKRGARNSSVLLRFSTLDENARSRSFAILNAIMDTQGSLTAFCQGVYEALETQLLATAMGVYLLEGFKSAPLFETPGAEGLNSSMISKLYKLVLENGLRVLLPDDITELAARSGMRYNEQVRFIAAPLTTENEMTGMLLLRLRLTAEFTAAEREMVRSVAWRLSGALQRFDQQSRSMRFAWYDSRTLLPNAAFFEQLLRRMCGESVKAPAGIQAQFKAPQSGSVAMIRVVPRDNDVMCALAPKLSEFSAARLSGGVFGVLLEETDMFELRERLKAIFALLAPHLPGGTALCAGSARFPFDALSAAGLLNVARAQLDMAKPNETVIYGG